MFLGTAGYAAAHAAKIWGFPPEFAILFGTGCAALLGPGDRAARHPPPGASTSP